MELESTKDKEVSQREAPHSSLQGEVQRCCVFEGLALLSAGSVSVCGNTECAGTQSVRGLCKAPDLQGCALQTGPRPHMASLHSPWPRLQKTHPSHVLAIPDSPVSGRIQIKRLENDCLWLILSSIRHRSICILETKQDFRILRTWQH